MDIMNINDPCTSLTLVADTSNRVEISKHDDYISVYNPADTVTYVKCGKVGVTASATDTWIPPGATLAFKKDELLDYIAGYNATEGVTLLIQTGRGI